MCWAFYVHVEHGEKFASKSIGSIRELKELYKIYEQEVPDNLFDMYSSQDRSDDECLCYLSFNVLIKSIFGDIIINELNNNRCIGFKKHNENKGYIIELEDSKGNLSKKIIFKDYLDLLKICFTYNIETKRKNIEKNSEIKFQNKDIFEAILKKEFDNDKDCEITFSWM
jgi:hypothetical protein